VEERGMTYDALTRSTPGVLTEDSSISVYQSYYLVSQPGSEKEGEKKKGNDG